MADHDHQDGKQDPGDKGGKPRIVEQDPKDIPQNPKHAQVPDINPPSVQPGHRDREQI